MNMDLAQLARERAMRNPAFAQQQSELLQQEKKYKKQVIDADEKIKTLENDMIGLKKELNRALNGCIEDNVKTVQLERANKLIKEKTKITEKEIIEQLQKIKVVLTDIDKPISICRQELEMLSDEFLNLEDILTDLNKLKIQDRDNTLKRLDKIKEDTGAIIESLIEKLVSKISLQKNLIDSFFLELSIRLENNKYTFNIVEFNQLMNSIKNLYFKQYNQDLEIEQKVEMETELDTEIAEKMRREEEQEYQRFLRTFQ